MNKRWSDLYSLRNLIYVICNPLEPIDLRSRKSGFARWEDHLARTPLKNERVLKCNNFEIFKWVTDQGNEVSEVLQINGFPKGEIT